MLKRVQKIFQGWKTSDKTVKTIERPSLASLATITIYPMEEKDTPEGADEEIPSLSRNQSPVEQQFQEIDEEFKSMSHELDSIHQDLGVIASYIMNPKDQDKKKNETKEPSMELELDSAVFTFDSSTGASSNSVEFTESDDNSDDILPDNMTDSQCTMDISVNEALLDAQAECIAINNESIQSQYEQLLQNQTHLQQQQYINDWNQTLATQLQEQLQESYATLHQLQQQVYYHRRELDQLAEQVISYEGVIQRHQKFIRDQEDEMDRNHKLLAYDKHLVGSLSYAFNAQPYANQIASLAAMSTF